MKKRLMGIFKYYISNSLLYIGSGGNRFFGNRFWGSALGGFLRFEIKRGVGESQFQILSFTVALYVWVHSNDLQNQLSDFWNLYSNWLYF